jgi:hydroxymethylpyrimidine pyrophosphatase-like HAD family hydrolase
MTYARAVALDFDGTIAIGGKPVEAVVSLLREGLPADLLRIIATGRSLHSLRSSWPEPWPADYLLFSSGAGLYDCRERGVIRKQLLSPGLTTAASLILEEEAIDYMVHFPIPDNHRFFYRRRNGHPDFERRVVHYAPYAQELAPADMNGFGATQLLAIGDREHLYPRIFDRLGDKFAVIRATSPLDGVSIWMEIFSPGVDKGSGLAGLCHDLGIERKNVLAVGNDYNDIHMLEWAGNAAVVADSPPDFAECFPLVPSAREGGAAYALSSWLNGNPVRDLRERR